MSLGTGVSSRLAKKPVAYRQTLGVVLLSILFLLSLGQKIIESDGSRNLYVLQAVAFLDRQISIDRYAHDVAVFEERFYVPFPPSPALLVLPVVAVFGAAGTNLPLISLLLTILNVGVLHNLLSRLAIERRLHFWVIAAFFLGTGYWLAALQSQGVWYFAHIVAVTFSLPALATALGSGRGWLAGLLLGIAFLSRQFTLGLVVVLVVAIWQNPKLVGRQRIWSLAGMGLALVAAVGFYLWFNYARFGHPLDTGYGYLQLSGFLAERVETYGLFSPAYVPFNLFYLFVQGFHVDFTAPNAMQQMVQDPFGTSLFAASPFVLVAFYARRSDRFVQSMWAVIGLVVAATAFYYNNGWVQFNTQRFLLDLWPLLILLVALGLHHQREHSQLWKWLIGYAILLNAFALYLIGPLNALLNQWTELWIR
jgi:hypothetical protein